MSKQRTQSLDENLFSGNQTRTKREGLASHEDFLASIIESNQEALNG